MSLKLFIYIQGLLISIIGLFQIIPLLFSIYYKENDLLSILLSILFSLSFGFILTFQVKGSKHKNIIRELKVVESLSIVTLAWIIVPLFASIPFLIQTYILGYDIGSMNFSFTNIYFEMMSGFTTTGSSILLDIEFIPKGLLLWRSLVQFLGGIGIILLMLAILPILSGKGMELYQAEVPGGRIYKDKIVPRISQTAKILWFSYLILIFFETFLLILYGMNFFDALCHSFSTISTGGFSTKNLSLGHYDSIYINLIVAFFMFISAINFSLNYRFFFFDESYLKDKEFKVYIYILLASVFIIILNNFYKIVYSINPLEKVISVFFQVISILTTTGFSIDIEKGNNEFHFGLWVFSSQFLILLLMIIGGSAGSTSGGIKCIRVYFLFQFIRIQIKKIISPKHIRLIQVGDEVITESVLFSNLSLIMLHIIIFTIASFFILAIEGKPLESITAVISSLGNVGPGLGDIGPNGNYEGFSLMSKWILIFCMLIGRLEYYSVLALIFYKNYFSFKGKGGFK